MTVDSDRGFAVRIAGLNAAGYCLTVTIATYVDARIPSNFRYGERHYRYGYLIALVGLPIFFITFVTLRRATTRGWKCFASCFALFAGVAASSWAFPPEIPHAGVVEWSAMYALVVLIATWLRYSAPDLSFVHDHNIPLSTRQEALKSTLSMWQTITLVTCAGFLAGLVPWASTIQETNSHVVGTESDLFLLNAASMLQVATVGVTILCGPIREVVLKFLSIGSEFAALRD